MSSSDSDHITQPLYNTLICTQLGSCLQFKKRQINQSTEQFNMTGEVFIIGALSFSVREWESWGDIQWVTHKLSDLS